MRGKLALRGATLLFAALCVGSATAAFAQDTRPAASPDAGPANIANYTLRATLDAPGHLVHGEGTITFTNTSEKSIDELWVHLYLNAFKNQRSVFLREPVGGFRGTTIPEAWGAIDVRSFRQATPKGEIDLWPRAELSRPGDEDETDARVPLAEPLPPGQTASFAVVWDDKLPSLVERTGFDGSFHMIAQWFPKIARLEKDGTFAHFPFHHLAEFYADFGRYDVTLDVPQGFVVGATGTRIESSDDKGRHVERRTQDHIHDFAWTAWDRFERVEDQVEGIKVEILHPTGYLSDALREQATIRFAIPHYRARYGPYPYPVLTVVHPPQSAKEAGGMEYPTLITTGSPWHGPPGIREVELVTIHEFGHQYFYGILASNEARWPFLDEGLNSFAESEALTAWLGEGSAASLLGLTVSDVTVQAMSGRRGARLHPIAQPSSAFATGSAYAGVVYGRTATLLHTLRRVHGPSLLDRAMTLYTERQRWKHPEPEDLLKVLGEVLGEQARLTARAALFEKGTVDYAVGAVHSARRSKPAGLFDRGGKRETQSPEAQDDYEGWVLVECRGSLSFPVELDLHLGDGSRTRIPSRDMGPCGSAVRVPYQGASALRGAVIDPEHKVLLDGDLTNNHAMAPGVAGAGARLVFERALHVASMVFGGLAP